MNTEISFTDPQVRDLSKAHSNWIWSDDASNERKHWASELQGRKMFY